MRTFETMKTDKQKSESVGRKWEHTTYCVQSRLIDGESAWFGFTNYNTPLDAQVGLRAMRHQGEVFDAGGGVGVKCADKHPREYRIVRSVCQRETVYHVPAIK